MTYCGGLGLPLVRDAMPHVGERLLVHLLVLDDRPDRLCVAQQRVIARAPRRRSRSLPRDARPPRQRRRAPRRGRARPDCRARRLRLPLRIDAAREDRFKMLVDAGTAEALS